MDRKETLTKLLIIICLIGAAVFFWDIKDKKIFLNHKSISGLIKPLTKNEVGSEAVNLQEAFVRVAEKVRPAVVNISSVQMIDIPEQEYYFGDPFEEFFRDFGGMFNQPGEKKQSRKKQQYRQEGGGSGVIISEDGYILTNEHVIHKADEIKVRVNLNGTDKTYQGRVAGKDIRTDLAVVKINAGNLPAAPLGNSDAIRVGEWVIAIGSPFGLEQTVTSGIISALRQSLKIEGQSYKDFIQTDAAINRGNSGGPLCNIKGEVIGINTAIYAPTGVFAGIGFAIPVNRAKEILDDLINKGRVIRGWLGVEIRPVDAALKKQFNLPDTSGAMVNSVYSNTPAERFGLKRGDVIREFDGKKINSPQELQNLVGKAGPRQRIRVRVIRDNAEKMLELVVGEMPPDEELENRKAVTEEAKALSWLGMSLSDYSEELEKKYKIPSGERGVVITGIVTGGKALEIGLQEGDLIKSVNRMPTTDMEIMRKAIDKTNLAEGVVFDILRQGKPLFISYASEE